MFFCITFTKFITKFKKTKTILFPIITGTDYSRTKILENCTIFILKSIIMRLLMQQRVDFIIGELSKKTSFEFLKNWESKPFF
jgi:hypothetical protein